MVQQWPPLSRLLGGVHGPGSFCFTPATSGDTDVTYPPGGEGSQAGQPIGLLLALTKAA